MKPKQNAVYGLLYTPFDSAAFTVVFSLKDFMSLTRGNAGIWRCLLSVQ